MEKNNLYLLIIGIILLCCACVTGLIAIGFGTSCLFNIIGTLSVSITSVFLFIKLYTIYLQYELNIKIKM